MGSCRLYCSRRAVFGCVFFNLAFLGGREVEVKEEALPREGTGEASWSEGQSLPCKVDLSFMSSRMESWSTKGQSLPRRVMSRSAEGQSLPRRVMSWSAEGQSLPQRGVSAVGQEGARSRVLRGLSVI